MALRSWSALGACFGRGARGAAVSRSAEQRAVHAVLQSRSWFEVLGLLGPSDADALSRTAEDLEAGLTDHRAPAEAAAMGVLTDARIVEAFICVGVEVHPFRNSHPDAALALRWVADAFANLRDDERRARASATHRGTLVSVREQDCGTTADESLRLFSEAISAVHARLSLHDLARGGVSKATADAILRGMHLLHLHPYLRDHAGSQERQLLDSVLAATLAANWLLASVSRWVTRPSQRQQTEWICSTTIAALGVIAFSGAARLQRMLVDDSSEASVAAGASLEPFVRCPLCRVATPAGRAIQDVHAGDVVPNCCVCTEQRANVCLSCGHLCLCGDCFAMLPRTTSAAA